MGSRLLIGVAGCRVSGVRRACNDKVVDSGKMRTQPAKFTLSGEGMCIGWDSSDAVTSQYKAPARFTGGTIFAVGVDTGKESYEDLEGAARRMLMTH
jgi:arylsulfatase